MKSFENISVEAISFVLLFVYFSKFHCSY